MADNQREQQVGLWAAPSASREVVGTVRVPGSKSLTNRALVIAAQSQAKAEIRNSLTSRDTRLMITALRALGVGIDEPQPGVITVTPGPLAGDAEIYCGLSGTVMRFVPPLAALAHGTVSFDGDPQAKGRPTESTVEALRQLGVTAMREGPESLPLRIVGTGEVLGRTVVIDSHQSSQFVSGLLLSGASYRNGIAIHHRGQPLPSVPHVAMTVRMLEHAGARVDSNTDDLRDAYWAVEPGPLNLGALTIEPDLSNAMAFIAAGLVTGGAVTVRDWPFETFQPDGEIRHALSALGAQLRQTEAGLTVTAPDRLSGISLDLANVGEIVPTVAAACLFADGPSQLTGIAHLRGHETDRLAALVTEINRLGGSAHELPDGLYIEPTRLSPTIVHTYHDHRMATFGAIVGLVVPGTTVENIETTSKTMPEFSELWTDLVVRETGRN